ncbi:MAG: RNA 2'-phosphotransferase [Rhodospirillaceae bacterium]|nr:RNA 2'-phosphotransferase [Rhodospirillaceae bacterium]
MNSSDVRTSKFLSMVLRHKPEKIGLKLDPAGWISIDALLPALAAHGMRVTRADLERVVAANEKRRFALSDDGHRIRAVQGHSRPVDLGLAPQTPPDTLFHGTVARFLAPIRQEGLKPAGRQFVHLSAERATALAVGARRGAPVVLVVDAAAMARDGIAFFRAENGVWLTATVAPAFIAFPGDAGPG